MCVHTYRLNKRDTACDHNMMLVDKREKKRLIMITQLNNT